MILTDTQWAIIAPHCLGRDCDPGRTGADPRPFVEAVLRIARTGCPWRDLPGEFGKWNAVFKLTNEITLAMVAGIGLSTLACVIHAYPTQAEAIKKAADAYNRTRLTPTVQSLLRRWILW